MSLLLHIMNLMITTHWNLYYNYKLEYGTSKILNKFNHLNNLPPIGMSVSNHLNILLPAPNLKLIKNKKFKIIYINNN